MSVERLKAGNLKPGSLGAFFIGCPPAALAGCCQTLRSRRPSGADRLEPLQNPGLTPRATSLGQVADKRCAANRHFAGAGFCASFNSLLAAFHHGDARGPRSVFREGRAQAGGRG